MVCFTKEECPLRPCGGGGGRGKLFPLHTLHASWLKSQL